MTDLATQEITPNTNEGSQPDAPIAETQETAPVATETVAPTEPQAEAPQQPDQVAAQEEADATPEADDEPGTYSVNAPEGQEFAPGFAESYVSAAIEAGVGKESAQAMIDKLSPVLQQNAAAMREAEQAEWVKQVENHPEIGGDKLQPALAAAGKVLNQFAHQGYLDLLEQTGLGNHPDVILYNHAISKAFSEDRIVGSDRVNSTPSGPKSDLQHASALYPKQH